MLNVGIIGASFARDAYLPAFAHIEGAKVVALASGRLESAKAAAAPHGITVVYDDWEKMLAEHALDLVCIATPTVMHAPMVLAAIARGAHVLCEKPTAMNAGEARAMLDAARDANRLHMIDHELRFNPTRARIAALIHGGDLGEIRHVNITNIGASWADPASRPKGDWWSDAAMGGGRLGANGSHQVDMLRWWLGEPASVIGQALTMVPNRLCKNTGEPWTATSDDLSHFTLEMQSGALAQVFMSGVAAANMGNETQVFGSKGTITLSNSDEKLYFAKAGESFNDISVEDPNATLEGLNKGIWNVSVLAALQELTAAIIEERGLKRGASFVDGLRNQMVLDAVVASTVSRKWEDLNMSGAV
ncbi:Gfo/Idh/MocA family oxidoreductase [Roseobacter sp. HKCCD9010]|uniref:Gfo/Idh/MocA family protein n=1 Tax=unclassified Roseobacter TaxID=196798 RepID=UPI0014926C09|nr:MULTISPECIES: Gfo/Idh/MocA family oxidoreductase [unclassified Roseobacter]MBF9049843.1 Gfo/Idh/MocA family oxidoreductase [Rhodobacterales bacterium HKCCD4356]NNV13618.1 Gfo/Idh/MocA family oxidoreductase [Roseobacter sp. HKCCD7357]NNV16452.1 Gfo/Idh/MocA family oxidoreductase [Roseobacter sp. HKCCD8768]NNV25911.1 Gfo/Idh/MocA family oxidoreductase [Roseobacter sp. HKCCD8192]NNV30169.1 Gfo/Idh/MocA family oxidoreductase [Roseobacter sp. HKCCD9061]